LPGGGGLTAPYNRSNRPLWTAGFRVVSAVVGACVLRLLVVFVPRTSSTPMATWFWQTEGRSADRVILGVRPSEFILSEVQSPSRRIFIGSHSLPPLSGRLIGPSSSALRALPWSEDNQQPWRRAGEVGDEPQGRKSAGERADQRNPGGAGAAAGRSLELRWDGSG
jgi:hypothetical protein